jgi:putative hydrolase of the HAD superfamily
MHGRAVEVVFLDLDGTIRGYRESTADLLAEAFDEPGVEPLLGADAYRDQSFSQVVTDETRAERREDAFRTLTTAAGEDPVVGRRLAAVYGSLRDHRDVQPLPGSLAALGIADAFEAVVYAGCETASEPEPSPFLRALSTPDVAPRRTVHVGNFIRANVWGADADPITAPD